MTTKQFEALKPYENYLITAVTGNWARHPGNAGLKAMLDTYNEVTGGNRRVNASCQGCVLSFLKDVGTLYLSHKETKAKAKAKKATTK